MYLPLLFDVVIECPPRRLPSTFQVFTHPEIADKIFSANFQIWFFFFQQSFFCPKQQASDPLQLCCPLEGIQPQIEDKPTLPDKNECGTQTGAPASCTLYNKVSILGVASILE